MKKPYLGQTLGSIALLLLLAGRLQAQDSSGHKFQVYLGFQVLDAANAFHFNRDCEVHTIYNGHSRTPMIMPSLGIKTGRFLQFVEYWGLKEKNTSGFDIGYYQFRIRYYSYLISYDPFPYWEFPLRPLIGLSTAYASKQFIVNYFSDSGGRWYKFSLDDHSKEWNLQIPVGVQARVPGFSFCITAMVPLYTRLKGNYIKDLNGNDYPTGNWSRHYESDYTLHPGSEKMSKSHLIMSIRAAFVFPNHWGKIMRERMIIE